MNCAYHANVESAAFCVTCGRALCSSCRRDVEGSVYCEACLADMIRKGNPTHGGAQSSSVGGESPGAAFALGLIPGVGAIYNGEFFKAAIHIVIFGLLISLGDAFRLFGPLMGLLIMGFYIYMPFEAYFTAKKRRLRLEGVELETPIDRLHKQLGGIEDKELWGGIALVAIGILFLLDNFGSFDIGQMFPLVLIALGVWRLWLYRERKEEETKDRPGGDGE